MSDTTKCQVVSCGSPAVDSLQILDASGSIVVRVDLCETDMRKALDGSQSPAPAAFPQDPPALTSVTHAVRVDRIAIEQFVARVQALIEAHHDKNGFTWKTTVGYTWGQKYIRVTVEDHGQRSVYCFVEEATGNILKADGWKRPARGVRGNIRQADLSTALTPHGAVYAR